MRIRGAVLDEPGRARPYAATAPLRVEELELDPPGPGEVLVRLTAAGLCHSDLSVIDGSRPRPVPMLLGHEAAGVVERVGDGGTLRPGQHVVLTFLPRCRRCQACALDGLAPCTAGSEANARGTLLSGARRLRRADGSAVHHHLGVSAFATHAVVDERSVVAIDDDVPAAVAATLGCAVLTGGGAVLNAGRPRPGARIAVVGLGGVGMAALLVACTQDPAEVIAVDVHPDKLDLARELGATVAVSPAAIEAGEGTGALRADVVIEAAGSARALATAIALGGVGSRIVTVGLPAPDQRVSLSPLELVASARTIIGSYLGSSVPSRDIPAYVGMWRDGTLPVERLVSSSLALDEVSRGMDVLADGGVLRQIIDFDAG